MSLTVGQLAKIAGLTVRALHHYDARGLLVPSQRSDAGYRLYSQTDVVRLYRIQALQRIGLSLADIAVALDRDSNALPQLIAQQLHELDEQIRRSDELRAHLRSLQDRLTTANGPALSDWLRALELLGTYDERCSPEEIQQLLAHGNDSEWPPFIRDVRSAMDRNIAPDSQEAQALARRWTRLALSRFGGDTSLAKKMKQMYLEDPSVQARVLSQSGFDPKMMQFCLQITMQAISMCWARHLDPAELRLLRMSDEWARDWFAIVADVRKASTSDRPTSIDAQRALRERWDATMLAFTNGNSALRAKVENVLHQDVDLQEFWSVSRDLLNWVRGVREATS
jgi:DNA-binding transcriptional MerR regulator